MGKHFLHDLRTRFANQPNRPAIMHRGRTTTHGELESLALRCAAGLTHLRVEPGDRVALFTADKFPFLVAQLGAMFAGAVPLPLNPRFTREEMRFFLTDSDAKAIVVGAEQLPMIHALAGELPQPPVVIPDSQVLSQTAPPAREPTVAADDPGLILYSSGTTGWPKGVVHSHANVASALAGLAACWRMSSDDVVVNALPLFHIHGLAFATHMTWLAGGCVAIEDAFEPAETLAAIGRGTVFMAVPPMYYRLLDDPRFRPAAKTWPNVRLFTCGSAPIRTEVLPELESILGRPVINRYGMTEAFVITSLPLAGPWPSGSVGLPLAGVELRVTRDDGTSASPGEVGGVAIRGPNLFRQYWQQPAATAAAFATGWFDTGDLGTLDANGMLTLVGRKHDLIITSGYNVYPQVVERVLGECPGVKECAVLGLPDADRGERVAAAVVASDPTLDEATLRNWCRDRLVHYQQPKTICIVGELPKNSLGKVLRRELREALQESANSAKL
ncbi:MAG: class I adenylate-forming enzyme family protein [Pirellulaceae bacterium]|nr:class I adenylate-forming enzyme family protein [Pirellulaceae bacterium]